MAWTPPTDPSFVPNYVPQKAYTKSTVHSLQNVDPYDFSGGRNRDIHDAAELTRGGLLGGLLSGFLSLGQLLNDLATALSGSGVFGPGPLRDIRDGQLDLNNNVELLSPLLDFGSVYMSESTSIFSSGLMNFDTQIGPMQRCRKGNSGIVLDAEGLWDIRAQLWFGTTIGNERCGWEIRVYRPNGTLYSVQRAQKNSQSEQSDTNITSVVVPAAGFYIQVWVTQIANIRSVLAGPSRNRLTVQHISRDTTTGGTGQ
ncbi:MAG: hypothetical protein WA972_20980 [Rhodococcus qingshengii]